MESDLSKTRHVSLYPCLIRSSLEAFAVRYIIGTMSHSSVCWLAGLT